MSRKPWINVLIALIFLGIAAGAGWRLYDIGYDHGVTHQIETTAATANPGASTIIVHDDYGHDHGFFPFFFIFPIGFFVLFFIVRPLVWGARWGRPGFGPGGMRQGLEEWHRQQHEKDESR